MQEPDIVGRSVSAGEVAAIVDVISGLADGNGATKAAVKLTAGDAKTRSVDLTMTVSLSWSSVSRSFAGRRSVQGSRDCSGGSVQDYLTAVCDPACQDPATAKRVADAIGQSPVEQFGVLQDGYRIGPLPHAAHDVDACSDCGGHGQLPCTAVGCTHGKVQCNACGFTGKERCTNCGGSGHVTVDGGVHNCGRCGGSGRYGNCYMCLGTFYVNCNNCRGTGQVGCGSCAQTSVVTHAYSTFLTGKVVRGIAFPADAPDGFRRSCQTVTPSSSLAQSVGSLVRAEAAAVGGEARLTLHCQVLHVHADMTCGPERISVDALGPSRAIPLMPSFLDGLTSELVHDIQVASRTRPLEALNLAGRARMTRDVLAAVVRGSSSDAVLAAAVHRWQGAVSEGHVGLVDESLRTAYGRAVHSPVRRTWLLLLPLVVVGSMLANAYQAPLWMVNHTLGRAATPSVPVVILAVLSTEAASVLPFTLFAWWMAARIGRKRLRAGVGDLAGRRGPRQGAWPAVGFALAMVTGFTTAALRLDAAPMGLPWAPPMLAGGRSFGEVLGREPATAPPVVKPAVENRAAPAHRPQDQWTHRP